MADMMDDSPATGAVPGFDALQAKGLGKTVPLPDGPLVILDDVSFAIPSGDRRRGA